MSERAARTRSKGPSPPVQQAPTRAPTPTSTGTLSGRSGLLQGAGPVLGLGVQRQVAVGAPGDRFEREADAASDRVSAGQSVEPSAMSPVTPETIAQTAAEPTTPEKMPEAMAVQKAAATPEEKKPVQTDAAGGAASPSPGAIAGAAIASKGAGNPLEPATRGTLESRLGTDLGQVRVHDDSAARASAQALNARAFTHGSDIWLGPGASQNDTRLMAHEATHVVQQAGGVHHMVQRQPAPSRKDPTAEGLVDSYLATSSDWYEREGRQELGANLYELVSGHPDAIEDVMAVLTHRRADFALTELKGISTGFVDAAGPDGLDRLAASPSGAALLDFLKRPLFEGRTQELRWAIAIDDALSRAAGQKSAEAVLEEAKRRAETAGPAVLGAVDPLQINEHLRLIRLMLVALHSRYDDDIEVAPAIASLEADLDVRFGVHAGDVIDFEEDARQVGATQAIVARCVASLAKFDRMLSPPDDSSVISLFGRIIQTLLGNTGPPSPGGLGAGPLGFQFLQLAGEVRKDWIAALDQAVMPEGANLLAVAESKSANLPAALTQLYLASVPGHGRYFAYYGMRESTNEMIGWVNWVQTKIASRDAEAATLEKARQDGAPDLGERQEHYQAVGKLIQLSIEGIQLWDQAIRAHEQLSVGISVLGHLAPHVVLVYEDALHIRQRCQGMKNAALAEDPKTLSDLADRNRTDPAINEFFANMPLFVTGANLLPSVVINLLVNFGIVKLASIAGSAAAGLISTGENASLLNVFAQVGLESLTFTASSRALQSAVGSPSRLSFLWDLALNAGLFATLRVTTSLVQTSFTARGLEVYAPAATQVVSFPILQAFGTLQFRLENNRWPRAEEIRDMSADGLIMYAALVKTQGGGSAARGQRHSGLAVLEMLHGKYGERLEAFEQARTRLAAHFYEQLRTGGGSNAQALEAEARTLEGSFRALVDEITDDPQIELDLLRDALKDPGLQTGEISEELLARSFDMPTEVGIRAAGELQYTYALGVTDLVVQALEARNATVTEGVDASGRHTLVAKTPDQPTLFFIERTEATPAAASAPTAVGGATSPRAPSARASMAGGTRGSYGPQVAGAPRPTYVEVPGKGQSSPLRLAERIATVFTNPTNPASRRVLAEGATLRAVAGPPGAPQTRYELVIPASGPRPEVVVPVRIESTPSQPTSVHGEDTGPAAMLIRSSLDSAGTRRYEASIAVHRDLARLDIRNAVGHELDELVRIVNSGASGTAITAQKRASLLRARGAAPLAPPPSITAHDDATALEFADFTRQASPIGGRPTNYALPDTVLSRALEMGFGETAYLDDKLSLLRRAGVDEDMLQRLRVRATQGAIAARIPLTSPLATARIIGHLLYPSAGSPASPIGGLHLHAALEGYRAELIATNQPRHLVRTTDSPHTAGSVTYNAYEQWRWTAGGVPGPRPLVPSGTAGVNVGGWVLAPEAKTTFNNLPDFLIEAQAAWSAWQAVNPLPAAGTNQFWQMVAPGGQQIAGYFNVTGSGTIEMISVFPYRTGGLTSW
jgi:hypothetical protein